MLCPGRGAVLCLRDQPTHSPSQSLWAMVWHKDALDQEPCPILPVGTLLRLGRSHSILT